MQVIVVEDENGNIVRESMKDTDVVARYKTMHETLVYLCHLDHEDTEAQMLEKLRVHVSPTLFHCVQPQDVGPCISPDTCTFSQGQQNDLVARLPHQKSGSRARLRLRHTTFGKGGYDWQCDT